MMWTEAHWHVSRGRAFCWCSCLAAVLWANAAARCATVTGTVTADGRPAAGARVSVMRDTGRQGGFVPIVQSAKTDGEGKYAVEDVPAGAYHVHADLPEHSGRSKDLVVRPGDKAFTIDLELRRLPAISGRMLLASGRPLANAKVTVGLRGATSGTRSEVTTGPDGSYRALCSFGAGTCTVSATAPGYATVTAGTIRLRPGSERPGVDFVFGARAGSISGVVYGPDGRRAVAAAEVRVNPVDTFEVSLRARGRDWRPPWNWLDSRPKAKVRADGSFAIADLQAGYYDVAAWAPGYLITYAPDAVRLNASQNLRGVKILLEPAGRIRGTIYGTDGRPLAKTRVVVDLTDEDGHPHRLDRPSLETDATGGYLIDNLPAGAFSMTVWAGDTAPATGEVTVEQGRTADGVDFHLLSGAPLAGTVSEADGTPLAEAKVYLRLTPRALGRTLFATTDEEGRFSVEHLLPGKYKFTAAPHDGLPRGFGEVTVNADGRSTVAVRLVEPAAIHGRVTDDAGRPIAEARVDCELKRSGVPSGPLALSSSGTGRADLTDEQGRYTIEGLIAGRWELRAAAEGHAPATVNALVTEPGQRVEAEPVTLPRGVSIPVCILLPDGKTPAANRRLTVHVSRGSPATRQLTTDAEGRLLLDDVWPRVEKLRFRAEGLAPAEVPIESLEVAKRGIEVRLAALGTIRGTLRRTDGELPAEGVWIVAGSSGLTASKFDLGVDESQWSWCTRLVPPAREWAIEGVAPGQRCVQVAGDGLALIEKTEVTVPEGGVVEVALEVSAGGSIAGRVMTADGKPVSGAAVRVEPDGIRIRELVPWSVTDEDGRYLLEHVTPGLRKLAVKAEGYAEAELDGVTVQDGTTTDDVGIELIVGGTVVGNVQTADGGEPFEAYSVYLVSEAGREYVRVRPDGSFAKRNVRPGVYEVQLLRPKPEETIATKPDVAVVEGETTAPIEFVVDETNATPTARGPGPAIVASAIALVLLAALVCAIRAARGPSRSAKADD